MASLESLWKSGREGTLSPLEQLRAWALFTVQKEDGGEEAVNYAAIAARVTKVGGGEPTREAIRQHIERVEKDPDWYPGKNYRRCRRTEPRCGCPTHGRGHRAEVEENDMQ